MRRPHIARLKAMAQGHRFRSGHGPDEEASTPDARIPRFPLGPDSFFDSIR